MRKLLLVLTACLLVGATTGAAAGAQARQAPLDRTYGQNGYVDVQPPMPAPWRISTSAIWLRGGTGTASRSSSASAALPAGAGAIRLQRGRQPGWRRRCGRHPGAAVRRRNAVLAGGEPGPAAAGPAGPPVLVALPANAGAAVRKRGRLLGRPQGAQADTALAGLERAELRPLLASSALLLLSGRRLDRPSGPAEAGLVGLPAGRGDVESGQAIVAVRFEEVWRR